MDKKEQVKVAHHHVEPIPGESEEEYDERCKESNNKWMASQGVRESVNIKIGDLTYLTKLTKEEQAKIPPVMLLNLYQLCKEHLVKLTEEDIEKIPTNVLKELMPMIGYYKMMYILFINSHIK